MSTPRFIRTTMTPAVQAAINNGGAAALQAIVDSANADPAVAALRAQLATVHDQINALTAQLQPLQRQQNDLNAQIAAAMGPDAASAQDALLNLQVALALATQ